MAWLLAIALVSAACHAVAAVPGYPQVRAAHRPSDSVFTDRHGEPVQTLRTDLLARRGAWLALAQFSPAMRELLVQGEDQRFWQHAGVDWSAAARSAWANAQGRGATQGASTLTMQLAALLDADLNRPAGGRSVGQKLRQMALARELESNWTKAQILEAYLNLVPLRGELVGVPAAAAQLFGKHPSGLDRTEAALLVALVRAPGAAVVRVIDRACALLAAPPGCERVAAMAERALAPGPRSAITGESLAPHFSRWVMAQARPSTAAGKTALAAWRPTSAAPATIATTLDARVQRSARSALRAQLAELQGRQVEDGAVVVLDNASGEVLAWVGSSGPGLSDAPQVDAVLARRQPGSTIKPFVYLLGFEQGLVTPASLLHDSPADLDGGSGAFMPRNYDHHYRGWVSARTALAGSLNVPTVRVANLVGPEALFERLDALGLGLSEGPGFHGLALALGSADVTLLQLTNAYRALANGGRWSPVRGAMATGAGTSTRRVADPRAVFQVTDVLADPAARATTFGLDSALVTRGFAAVKTGTSKDMRDNWCIGFTDRYTVGVWVGNASGAAMHRISGTQGAAPVWRTLVQQLHAGRVSRAPPPPAGLVRQQVAFDGGIEPTRSEWMRADMAGDALALLQQRGEQAAQQRPVGIASPRDGSVFALDPDMPSRVQRIVFSGEPGNWWLDGRPIGSGASLPWAPWPGKHQLALKDTNGRLMGSVAFEVRGAVATVAARGAPEAVRKVAH
ncbi:MAG: penicillin-binding protein 1C [Ideonella sp.]|nr:penicillin-binding protein 1C [Ideonella sp.]